MALQPNLFAPAVFGTHFHFVELSVVSIKIGVNLKLGSFRNSLQE